MEFPWEGRWQYRTLCLGMEEVSTSHITIGIAGGLAGPTVTRPYLPSN